MFDKIVNWFKGKFGYDALLHIIFSCIIVSVLDLVLPMLLAVIITLVLGLAKEVIYDKLMKKGTFDKMDLLADVIGTIIGII